MPREEIIAVRKRIAILQRQLDTLMAERPMPIIKNGARGRRPVHQHSEEKKSRENQRINRITIARGVSLTTLPGSLYSTLLRVLAALGHLDNHDNLFGTFQRAGTQDAAKELLRQIGVARTELDGYVHLDEEFGEHCDRRTLAYKKRAAAGDARYQRILTDRKIFDAHGRWAGDIDEALHILSGGRRLPQLRRGKNVRILNRARLMFDIADIAGTVTCFLYKRRWHGVFKRALFLAQQ